jgi:hypothetical protein
MCSKWVSDVQWEQAVVMQFKATIDWKTALQHSYRSKQRMITP